jgi:hypothetical protein
MNTTKIPVIPRRNHSLEINGEEYSLKEGETVEIPKWLAEILDVECIPLKSTEIKAIIMKERSPNLTELPHNLYERMEISPDRETQKTFLQLLDIRLEKIAKNAVQNTDLDIHLPHQEQILYNRIRELVSAWKKNLLQIILQSPEI